MLVLPKLKDQPMKKNICLFLTLLCLFSCQPGDMDQTVTVENNYSIVVPFLMEKAEGLNDAASLEYQHAWKELYVMVIDEPKTELREALEENDLLDVYTNDFEGYIDLVLSGFEESISVTRKSEIIDTRINGMPAKLLTIAATVDDYDVYYSLGFLEGKKRYYQVFTWTLADKKEEYGDQMKRMLYSLKEL